jgi:hypothetical protein
MTLALVLRQNNATPYALRVVWTQAEYQANPAITIACGVGNAVAAGSTAGVGVYGAVRVTWAQAQYEATSGTTITPTVGNAVAGGPAGTTVSVALSIGAGIGNAVASSPVGTTVSVDALIATGIGGAIAAGLRADILPPAVPSVGATPGPVSPRPRYRVRIGSRWVEVDPLDPVSVRRAVDAAQEQGQEAAADNVESPAEVAAQAVAVEPVIGPDYAALAREARRISDSIRKAYADALQTELIARLMRERIEQDDEDDIAVLLASI